MKSEFEKELTKQGFLFQEASGGYYNIVPKSRIVLPTLAQLVISKPVNLVYHGSQNGNELDAIGNFHFTINSENNPDYFIFVFKHMSNGSCQYMIISSEDLRQRLMKNIIRHRSGEHLEIRIWQMDGHIYDSSAMSLEAEWYYLSKGRGGGRMIDSTLWNYTNFLNNWDFGFGFRE